MSRRLVLDASAAIEAVLGRPRAAWVLDLLGEAGSVVAPELYATEVANALWKHSRAGDIDDETAHEALEAALSLVDETVPLVELAHEALATAQAHGHPVYDALYAVVARRRGATVCTLDRRLTVLLAVMVVPHVTPDPHAPQS